jgi:hypothetical protein
MSGLSIQKRFSAEIQAHVSLHLPNIQSTNIRPPSLQSIPICPAVRLFISDLGLSLLAISVSRLFVDRAACFKYSVLIKERHIPIVPIHQGSYPPNRQFPPRIPILSSRRLYALCLSNNCLIHLVLLPCYLYLKAVFLCLSIWPPVCLYVKFLPNSVCPAT